MSLPCGLTACTRHIAFRPAWVAYATEYAEARVVRILIIEDERRLAENVARSVRESAGYAVDCAFDGQDGLYMAESNPYDLILLDLLLPQLDGLTLVRRLRTNGSAVPILVLTARDEKDSVVALLNAGADDYVTKPFDLGELIARAKALVRRGKGRSDAILRFQDIEIKPPMPLSPCSTPHSLRS